MKVLTLLTLSCVISYSYGFAAAPHPFVGSVVCPDREFQCPDKTTCCKLAQDMG